MFSKRLKFATRLQERLFQAAAASKTNKGSSSLSNSDVHLVSIVSGKKLFSGYIIIIIIIRKFTARRGFVVLVLSKTVL